LDIILADKSLSGNKNALYYSSIYITLNVHILEIALVNSPYCGTFKVP